MLHCHLPKNPSSVELRYNAHGLDVTLCISFQDMEEPKILYLLSGWKDVPIHYQWMQSKGIQSLLEEMKSTVAVMGLVQLEIISY